MNPIKIKICGMREPENIKAVCALNPDYIGFIFYPKSKRFVADKNAENIISAIPENILKVGVFVNSLLPEIVRRINLFSLDFIQLHGDEPKEYCAELKNIGVKIIKSFGIDQNFNFSNIEQYSPFCDYFLFDTKSLAYGGTGVKFNWLKLAEFAQNKPVFLSGGIGVDDAIEIKNLKNINLHAVDLNSKFEIKPALKDSKLLYPFIKEIRNTTT